MANRLIVYNATQEQNTELMQSGIMEDIVSINSPETKEMKIVFERDGVAVARIAGGGLATAEEIREACNDNFKTTYAVAI